MIAIVGQCTIDRVRLPDGAVEERLGGPPYYAAAALRAAGADGVVLTRGATPALRAGLVACGLPVVVGPGDGSLVSELEVFGDGRRRHVLAALGDPFTATDVATWMAPALAAASVVVAGPQWRGELPPATVAALAAGGRTVLVDAQGPARPARLGPVREEGPLDAAWLPGVAVLKCSEEEAAALFPDGIVLDAVPVVVVTRGVAGATVHAAAGVVEIAGAPVAGLADAIGAGDTFLALMGVAMERGADPATAARTAAEGTSAILRRRLEPGP